MCLGVPGRVVQWLDHDEVFGRALVEFSGACREVHMACVPDAKIGDYVVVHAGIAICQVDEEAAGQTLADVETSDKSFDVEQERQVLPTDGTQL